MRAAVLARLCLRESRGSRGRLVVFVLCLAVGVAAVVSVAHLSEGLRGGVRSRARDLLAADLVVSSRSELPEALDELLAQESIDARTDTVQLVTVVAAPPRGEIPGSSRLVEIKAVDGPYPHYGQLELDPPLPLSELLGDDAVVVAPGVLTSLGLRPGDQLRVGGVPFTIAGTVLAEPEKLDFNLMSGPRVFISRAGLDRTPLLSFGSRVRFGALLALPAGTPATEVDRLERRLESGLPDDGTVRVETYTDAQPALRRGVDRTESFLGLLALLSLLIGGIGVAQTVRAWLIQRLASIAILRCLGLRPREVLLLYLIQTALLGLLGSAIGVVAGVAFASVLPHALDAEAYFPALRVVSLSAWQPWAALRGLGLGTGVALLFALPSLLAARSVPPLLVLRRDAELKRRGRLARALVLVLLGAGIFGAAWAQSQSPLFAGLFTGGLAAVSGALALAARALIWLAARAPRRRLGLRLRHGLAAVARPDSGTRSGTVALGVGTAVVLALQLVQSSLEQALSSAVPATAPTEFLVDIQPDQWEGVQSALAELGAESIESVPMLMARLSAIDGKETEDLVRRRPRGSGRSRWVLTREQRLTWLPALPADNVITEGALWSDPSRLEVSVEQEFAEDLDVGLGSVLRFDVQGRPVELVVTSLREVEWNTFGPNFFLVAEPGALDDVPHVRLAAARLPPGGGQRLQDLLAVSAPNVSVIRVHEILEKVRGVLDQVALGVRLLGLFSVAAGVAILAGSIGTGAWLRRRQIALLKTLGATRADVTTIHAVESALVGAVAGVLGALGGAALAWTVFEHLLELPWDLDYWPLLLVVPGVALLSAAAGRIASSRALAVEPAVVLRTE